MSEVMLPMADRVVTLTIPDPLYDRYRQRAEQHQRPVEDELVDGLASAVTADDDLPSDVRQELRSLATLDDAALWRVARAHLPGSAARRLTALNRTRQREGLTEAELATANDLLRQFDHIMLRRAQAAALLRQRGHEVGELVGD